MKKELQPIDFLDEESEKINDVLKKSPNWITAWGSGILVTFLAALLSLTFIIKYPLILTGEIMITTENPPARIIGVQSGYVEKVCVPDKSYVNRGQPLIIFRNPANSSDVLDLFKQINSLSDQQLLNDTLTFNPFMELGEIQENYDAFINAYHDYHENKFAKPLENELANLSSQIFFHADILKKKKELRKLELDQFKFVTADFEREKKLFDAKVISSKDFELRTVEYLNTKKGISKIELEIVNEELLLSDLKYKQTKLETEIRNHKTKLDIKLLNNFNILKKSVSEWRNKYLVEAPVNGELSYLTVLSQDKFIQAGKELVSVNMPGDHLTAKMFVPVKNAGRIKKDQRVNVHLHDYPYYEYGTLVGSVSDISLVSSENSYLITVSLSNGLMSTYNKKIPFKHELLGTAEIITEDLLVIERILFNFRQALNR